MKSCPLALSYSPARARPFPNAGDLEGAYETISQAFENNPTDLGTARNLIALARVLNRPDETIQWAERAVSLIENGYGHSDMAIAAYHLVAEVYQENGRLQEAADILHSLIAFAPEDYRFPFQLARVNAGLGNNLQARRFAETALSLAPENEKQGIQSFVDSLE